MNGFELPAEIAALATQLRPTEAEIPSGDDRPAAVLIILFPRDGEIWLLLTIRSDSLSRHAGQISLPGGALEEEDPSLMQTALREAREELGLQSEPLVILGRLDDFSLRVTKFSVTPFVAWSPEPLTVNPDPREVSEVIEVPVSAILDSSSVRTEQWNYSGRDLWVTFYKLGRHEIWGATARILYDLARRLQPGSWQLDPSPGSVVPVTTPP